jgi:hypothetical protein
MRNSARSRAETQFTASQVKANQQVSELEQSRQAAAKRVADLRALRLAKEAAEEKAAALAAEAARAEKIAAKKAAARKKRLKPLSEAHGH